MKETTDNWREEFDKDFDHWVLGYLMADDAFDMDLRESVARDELKSSIQSLINKAKEEERDRIIEGVELGEMRQMKAEGWEKDANGIYFYKDDIVSLISKYK